ncbi:fasciclin-like arabinogalactan protein 8 [Cynara cardunculus var. scolymus]|nr:fasciclin-like arabinogalactan protein 8 [Cynara cardunculus var. scolymus]
MDTLRIIIVTLALMAAVSTVAGHNITDILSEYPEYSVFNSYLSQTKLADEINSRQTITVLVFNNSVLAKFLSNDTLSVVKIVLSIHVLLDYFDMQKLKTIGGGTVITTTLYQTTGNAIGSTGFVNITDLNGGKVGFGSAAPGSKLDSLFIKSVKQIPYNISVVEIDLPIIPLGILTGGAPSGVNISSLLETAGCKTFAKLITDTGVLKIYETVSTKGLTVFAPSDAAFKAGGLPNLNKLTNAELVSMLLFHACSNYIPRGSLKTEKNPIHTLATTTAGKFELTVQTNGDSVTLVSGVDSSRVESTALDSVPLSIFKIQNVLLPTELFTKSPPSVPAPAPETSTPSAPTPASAPRTIASSPAPVNATSPVRSPPSPSTPPTAPTPPTPSISSPIDAPAPAENPAADTGKSNAGDGIKVPGLFVALVTASISGIISSIAA